MRTKINIAFLLLTIFACKFYAQTAPLQLPCTNLDFENIDTRKLLLTLDFQFFLNRNADNEKYSQGDLQNIYNTYATKLKEIEEKSIENFDITSPFKNFTLL